MKTRIVNLIVLVSCSVLYNYAPIQAASPSYELVDLSSLLDKRDFDADDEVIAYAINDAGQIVGVSDVDRDERHAFLWQNGIMVDLGTMSSARDINNIGQVVGYGKNDAVLWQDGVMVELENASEAHAINDAGVVVGGYQNAWFWENGNVTELGTLGGTYSKATAINNNGQVVGESRYSPDSSGEHAFLWSKGTGMIDLGTLGGTTSYARDINDSGQVVGGSNTADGEGYAFLWDSANGMRSLGTLGGNSSAYAINDLGQAVGTSRTANGEEHIFLWDSSNGMVDLHNLLVENLGEEFQATDINNHGQIVGHDYATNRAYLLTPADISIFTTDTTMSDGDTYNNIVVDGASTVVNIDGGRVINRLAVLSSATVNISGNPTLALIETYDTSTVNIAGNATVGNIKICGYSMVTIVDGSVNNQIDLFNSSILNLSGGTIDRIINCRDSSKANITDGSVNKLNIAGTSQVDLSGGTITTIVADNTESKWCSIDVFGNGLEAKPYNQDYFGLGSITGTWLDGSPINVNIDKSVYPFIVLHEGETPPQSDNPPLPSESDGSITINTLDFKLGLDSLSIKGKITIQDESVDLASEDITIHYGNYEVTLSASDILQVGKKRVFKYKKPKLSSVAIALFDLEKGTFEISIKNAAIGEQVSPVSFSIEIGDSIQLVP